MGELRKLTDSVWSFLDRASDLYGQLEADHFAQEMQSNCLELGLESPIEDMFWIACALMTKAAYNDFNPEPYELNGQIHAGHGIHLTPQHKVGKYRVDFLLSQSGIGPDEILTPVVVELDGHAFHDKDARQRSYEKARDRDLVKAGYRVIHFTGSDIVKYPFACAFEALEMVGVFSGTGIREYNPNDPTFRGD